MHLIPEHVITIQSRLTVSSRDVYFVFERAPIEPSDATHERRSSCPQTTSRINAFAVFHARVCHPSRCSFLIQDPAWRVRIRGSFNALVCQPSVEEYDDANVCL